MRALRGVVMAVGLLLTVTMVVPTTQSSAHAEAGPGTAVDLPVVADAVTQFSSLSRRPDGLGFDIGASPDPEACKHYQGMARVHAPDGTPYMLISRSGNHVTAICPFADDDPGNLLVVEMGSRERTAERLRSNRLARGWSLVNPDPDDATFWPTPPDRRDRVVTTITFDGTGGWPDYGHPGGMQLVDQNVLAVAMETPYADAPENRILFIDVSDPTSPTLLSHFDPPDPGGGFKAGLLGVVAIRDQAGECCQYLMAVTGGSNTRLRFYRSLPNDGDATDLRLPSLQWEEVGRFTESEIESCLGADWHTGIGDAHQMLNFVRQGSLDGPLFLMGARNDTKFLPADDMVDLYRVNLTGPGQPDPSCPLTHEDTRHLTSYPYMGGGDSAIFAAAAGVYVSPAGELLLYATEYENDGPDRQEADGSRGEVNTVRFGEWRHHSVVRPGSPTLRPTATVDGPVQVDEGATVLLTGTAAPARTQAWIQLYEDDDAGPSVPGAFDSDQWIVVDYPDRDADDFDDFRKILYFNNEAGSWRWFAPQGCTIYANDYAVGVDGFPGPDSHVLEGTGAVVVNNDLDKIGFDDDLGSITFGADCDAYYRVPIGLTWDLDDDGTFETAGTQVTFDAGTLDGPAAPTVTARGEHPTDSTALGTGAPTPLTITVRNVAPQVQTLDVTDELGNSTALTLPGRTVTVDVAFTDPGLADTQTATIDWGDGTVDTTFDDFTDANGGVMGQLLHTHAYDRTGEHDIAVRITDDDGGTTTVIRTITVMTPAEALAATVDELDVLITSTPDGPARDSLVEARDDIVGNHDGQATNGALTKLDDDEPATAITMIGAAVEHLVDAETAGAGDLTALKDLLGLIAITIADQTCSDVSAVLDPPSRGQGRQLDRASRLLDSGTQALQDDRYETAIEASRQATEICLGLVD